MDLGDGIPVLLKEVTIVECENGRALAGREAGVQKRVSRPTARVEDESLRSENAVCQPRQCAHEGSRMVTCSVAPQSSVFWRNSRIVAEPAG